MAKELERKGPADITARVLHDTPWIEIVPAVPLPERIVEWALGSGESSVLAIALGLEGSEAIIDDLAARKCASCLGIQVRGTLGIVLAAKQRGHISSARSVINDLLRGGMYLSEAVLNEAMGRVGE